VSFQPCMFCQLVDDAVRVLSAVSFQPLASHCMSCQHVLSASGRRCACPFSLSASGRRCACPFSPFVLSALSAPWGTGTEFVAEAIKNNLLIIPGNVFSERDSHFRISYAVDDATLRRGLELLRKLARSRPV
jgi:hypothetical protein